MTGIPEALEQLRSALAGVFGFDDPAGWSDDDLLAALFARRIRHSTELPVGSALAPGGSALQMLIQDSQAA